jgi:hypothetical protein
VGRPDVSDQPTRRRTIDLEQDLEDAEQDARDALAARVAGDGPDHPRHAVYGAGDRPAWTTDHHDEA